MRVKILLILFLTSFFSVNAQEFSFSTMLIPENLKENANSIIRSQKIDIEISSQSSIRTKTKKVVTVLNKSGLNNIDAIEYYSKSERVLSIEATVYNSFGKELKKIKRKDFSDQSIADGFSILTDGRFYQLNYTPTEYPFTVVYESETQSSNTAFIPSWQPIDDYFESVQKSEIIITYPSNLGFKYKEFNFLNGNIKKEQTSTTISYSVENLSAEKAEEFSPSSNKIFASVRFGLDNFYLEGIEGDAKSWKDFGNWIYENLLKDTEELSDETINKIKSLVLNVTDPIEKAKIIYKYVQDKTRYVSIQLGIGGWKPMNAKDVDRLGYGDCKALSNYTRVLLKTIGVDSYYTIIYGGRNKKNIENDFVAMQGNHAILTIPSNDKLIFLECTSQTVPFGYQGTFTDNRSALIVKPNFGGEIVNTNEYSETINSQLSKGNYKIDENGKITGNIVIKSKGIQYDNKSNLEFKPKEEIDEHYKNYFLWINNLKLEKIKFNNDKNSIEFTEELKMSAENYANKNGTSFMFPLNAFNQSISLPQRYRNRRNNLEIDRGFFDEDVIEINLPIGYVIDAKPNDLEINEKFGKYKIEIQNKESGVIIYKRSLIINKGFYDKTEYENFRLFKEKIAKADNSKIVLIQK